MPISSPMTQPQLGNNMKGTYSAAIALAVSAGVMAAYIVHIRQWATSRATSSTAGATYDWVRNSLNMMRSEIESNIGINASMPTISTGKVVHIDRIVSAAATADTI